MKNETLALLPGPQRQVTEHNNKGSRALFGVRRFIAAFHAPGTPVKAALNRRTPNGYVMGVVFCLVAVLSWGGMFPIMGSALTVVNPFMFTAIRYTAAAALFLSLLYYTEGPKALRLDRRAFALWVLGSLGFAGFGFLVFAGQKMAGRSGAVSASVMMALMPLLSVLINWLFRSIKPLKYSLCFVLMSFAGVLCVVTRGDFTSLFLLEENVLADLLILLGAVCWVIYTIGASAFPGWSALRYTALTTALGVSTIWAVNLASAPLAATPCRAPPPWFRSGRSSPT
jgi:drug/metabolite transporter (DMT)-like permease